MESDSSQNSLADNLDQIGRLHFSIPNVNFSHYINPPKFNFPNLPSLHNLPRIKSFPEEISNYITNYVGYIKDDETIASIKTAISTRIQMNNFLTDLKEGLSFNAAIDRLEALKSVVHETIILPVEGGVATNKEPDYHKPEFTEPKGVQQADLRKHQPLVNELVNPNLVPAGNSSVHNHGHGHGHTRHKKRNTTTRRFISVLSDDSIQPGSDLDYVDEFSSQEVKALTDLHNKNDFSNEGLLRGMIQKIQALDGVSQKLKSKLVTRLMMGNYYKYVNEAPPEKIKRLVLEDDELDVDDAGMEEDDDDDDDDYDIDNVDNVDNNISKDQGAIDILSEPELEDIELQPEANEVFLTEMDLIPTYTDPFKTEMGCNHYQRNCKLECPTCQKWYTCRFCHDEQEPSHKMIREQVRHILCMSCQTPQEPRDNDCVECGRELANYFCEKCVLYDNDPTKDIYHCEKCGICRLGLGLGKDYFHCDTCNICLSIDLKSRHKCLLNSTHCNCPICNEYLFNSIQKVVFMKCGHLIHQECLAQMSTYTYKCPLCKTSVIDMETQFRILDLEILELPLPPPYQYWRCIVSCNDCKGKSNVPYHVLGLKCEYCKSYNTNQHKLIKPEEEEENDIELSAERLLETENAMRLMATNLGNNFNIIGQNSTQEDDLSEEFESETNTIREVKARPPKRERANTRGSITSDTVTGTNDRMKRGSSLPKNDMNINSNNEDDNDIGKLEEKEKVKDKVKVKVKEKEKEKYNQSQIDEYDEDADFELYRDGNLLDLTALRLQGKQDRQDQSYIASVLQGFINSVLSEGS